MAPLLVSPETRRRRRLASSEGAAAPAPGRRGWRQPKPDEAAPATAPRGSRIAGLRRSLTGVFEASEDENKQVILDTVAAGPQRPRVLDLGCFNGAFTVDLGAAARASSLTGVEWLPEHADAARAVGVDVAEADLNEPLPFADDAFDLVHANQVIEHLRRTDTFLREARRVCAPGGTVLLSTNNLAAWHNVASLVLGYQPFPAHVSDEVHVGNPLDPRRGLRHADEGQTHLRIFTARSLVELARTYGLELVGLHMNGYYPLPPRLARHAVRLDGRHAAFMVVELRPAPVPA
jgi:SAM-dependent methyltransferase